MKYIASSLMLVTLIFSSSVFSENNSTTKVKALVKQQAVKSVTAKAIVRPPKLPPINPFPWPNPSPFPYPYPSPGPTFPPSGPPTF